MKLYLRSSLTLGINDSILWSDECLPFLRTLLSLRTNVYPYSFLCADLYKMRKGRAGRLDCIERTSISVLFFVVFFLSNWLKESP